jgi:hypothetical protein
LEDSPGTIWGEVEQDVAAEDDVEISFRSGLSFLCPGSEVEVLKTDSIPEFLRGDQGALMILKPPLNLGGHLLSDRVSRIATRPRLAKGLGADIGSDHFNQVGRQA